MDKVDYILSSIAVVGVAIMNLAIIIKRDRKTSRAWIKTPIIIFILGCIMFTSSFIYLLNRSEQYAIIGIGFVDKKGDEKYIRFEKPTNKVIIKFNGCEPKTKEGEKGE